MRNFGFSYTGQSGTSAAPEDHQNHIRFPTQRSHSRNSSGWPSGTSRKNGTFTQKYLHTRRI